MAVTFLVASDAWSELSRVAVLTQAQKREFPFRFLAAAPRSSSDFIRLFKCWEASFRCALSAKVSQAKSNFAAAKLLSSRRFTGWRKLSLSLRYAAMRRPNRARIFVRFVCIEAHCRKRWRRSSSCKFLDAMDNVKRWSRTTAGQMETALSAMKMVHLFIWNWLCRKNTRVIFCPCSLKRRRMKTPSLKRRSKLASR